MRIVFTEEAVKDIARLDIQIQLRIKKKLQWFVDQENSLMFVIPIKDKKSGGYRFRIGAYRVIFDVENGFMTVHVVGHRRAIYKPI